MTATRCLALLLVLGSTLPASAQAKTQPYVDSDNGVAFMPPEKWKCIPTPKESKYAEWAAEEKLKMLAKWSAPQPDADNYSQDLELFLIKDAKDLDAALKAYSDDRSRWGREFEIKKQQDILIQGKHKGKWLLADAGGRGFAYMVAILCDGTKAFAMEFTGGMNRAEKAMPDRLKVVMTWQFLSEKDIEKIRKAGTKPLPGWNVHKTEHYDIQYNCDRDFAVTVGKHLEAILLEYQKFFPLDSFGGGPVTVEGQEDKPSTQKTTLDRMTVKLFGKDEEFQSYAAANGVGGAAAYFSPMQNELCGYKTVSQGKKLSIHIMYHEAMHQYLHALFGEDVRIPIWLNEGMAEYFFGGEFDDVTGRFVIGPNKMRLDGIRQACREGSYVPLAKLFKYTQGQYYANAGLCYAEGWSIAYFLWRTTDEKYKGVIENFMKKLRQTKDADKAFGKLDIDTLEKDWKDFVLNKI
jgi:hypothetical protein